ncbi:hypothetical protein [Cystobacter ferrugineus]|uniref:Uncharacterized protein n=1 Tax=Cystobacter ferrugineus TaxID=83449 RepID=A0A1L9B1B7_9BACT|nr:hypothetical protein [Cystobacter ferrugineus]OJH36062.1 hypothetical protein BON30_36335 [Cystobacter ferrugineus]
MTSNVEQQEGWRLWPLHLTKGEGHKLSLKAFWEALEKRLGASSLEDLRTVLRAMANRVHPSERQSFLDSLAPVPDDRQQALEHALQDKLLADITEQAQRFEELMDEAHSDWDEYGEDSGPGPYAELVAPVTALFQRAQRAFERGRWPLARDAYRALFELLQREDDYGLGLRPEHLEEVDIPEVWARYLSALYRATPPARRAEALWEAMKEEDRWRFGPPPKLQEVRDISPEPLPDLENFLSDWEAFLRKREDDSEAEAWLREAVGLSRGAEGLRELARAGRGRHPRAWVDLLALLESEGQPREVLDTAHEALKALPARLPLRAWVADFLATAAERLALPEQVREARWESFVACPGLKRLLDLRECGETEPERARLMKQAARQVQKALAQPHDTGPMPWEEPPLPRGERDEPYPRLDEVLLAQARLLGHDWQAAWKSAAGAEVLGWSSDDNPQGLVVPFLLLWLSDPPSPEGPSRSVEKLWSKVLENSSGSEPWSTEEAARELSERLTHAYDEVLAALSVSRPQQEELLEGCLEVARERARAIVREKHRRSYDKAALLLAACAEVLQRRGQPTRAQEFLRRFREEFPRHSAFQAELDTAMHPH